MNPIAVRTNALLELHNAPQTLLDALRRHLAVPLPVGVSPDERFGSSFWHEGTQYGSLLRGHRLPSGLAPHVENLARHYGIPLQVHDTRQRPEEMVPWWSVRGVNWRPYQEHVKKLMLKEHVGIVEALPRSGKTLMALSFIDGLAHNAVIVAPSVAIVRQTYLEAVRHFGEDFVARLDGEATEKERDASKPIVVATAPSAVRMPAEWWKTRRVLVIDEFHHAAAATYHKISELAENAYYRLFLTGTHFRTGGDQLAMEAVCSRLIYKIPIEYMVRNGYLADARVRFVPVEAPLVFHGDWKKAYDAAIVEGTERNALVAQLANQLAGMGMPTVVIVKRRAHADHLGTLIHNSIVAKGGEGALTQRSLGEFRQGQHQVLIGTSVLGEGVDLPNARALIYAAGGSGSVSMVQSYYRPLTAFPGKSIGYIYDFLDTSHGVLRRQAEDRYEFAEGHLGAGRVMKLPRAA